MNYYKFVSWDAVELEKVKAGRVPLAIAAADRGDMKPLKECYKNTLSIEHLQNPVYKIGGWAFSLREYCRRYWVKTIYQSIRDAEKAAEEWRKANGKEPKKEKPVVYGAWNTPRI